MITQNLIGWFLIAISSLLIMYYIRHRFNQLTKPIKQFCSVSGKLRLFETRFLITENNQYVDVKFFVENLSNQVISVRCDTSQSHFIVDGVQHHNLVVYNNNLYPYSTHSLQIHLMDLEKIPIDKEFRVKIYAIFNYGAFDSELSDIATVQFESMFLLSKTNCNNYHLKFVN